MPNLMWWDLRDHAELSSSLTAAIHDCTSENDSRTRDLYTWLRLYDRRAVQLTSETVKDYFADAPGISRRDPLPCNMVRRVVDFAVNRIGKTYPGVSIETTNTASWDDKQAAKQLGRLVEGTFSEGDVYEVAKTALLHGCLLGVGAVKVIEDGDRVSYEWVFPGELRIPLLEQMYGRPKTLYQHKWIDVATLRTRFSKRAAGLGGVTGFVETVECWRLPSRPATGKDEGSQDGRHIIIVLSQSGIILVDEPWTYADFPFAWFRYDQAALGFFPAGLGKALMGFQYDINVTLSTIRENAKAAGHLWIWAPPGIMREHITDEVASIIEGPTRPEYVVNPIVSPDLAAHLYWLVAQCWEETGFSQTAAASQKPAGVTAAVALNTLNDMQTERQALLGISWESLFRQLTLLTIDASQRIYEREGKYEATWAGKGELASVAMADAMVDRDLYRVKVQSTSRLPDSVTGRQQVLAEWMDRGLVSDPMTIMRLLDVPDLASELAEATAPRDLVDSMIARILRGEKGVAPHERMPLALARDRANLAYCLAQKDGAPTTVLDKLAVFADLAEQQAAAAAASQQAAMQQAMTEQQGMGGAPELPPGPEMM
jgi:hypothetical protein